MAHSLKDFELAVEFFIDNLEADIHDLESGRTLAELIVDHDRFQDYQTAQRLKSKFELLRENILATINKNPDKTIFLSFNNYLNFETFKKNPKETALEFATEIANELKEQLKEPTPIPQIISTLQKQINALEQEIKESPRQNRYQSRLKDQFSFLLSNLERFNKRIPNFSILVNHPLNRASLADQISDINLEIGLLTFNEQLLLKSQIAIAELNQQQEILKKMISLKKSFNNNTASKEEILNMIHTFESNQKMIFELEEFQQIIESDIHNPVKLVPGGLHDELTVKEFIEQIPYIKKQIYSDFHNDKIQFFRDRESLILEIDRSLAEGKKSFSNQLTQSPPEPANSRIRELATNDKCSLYHVEELLKIRLSGCEQKIEALEKGQSVANVYQTEAEKVYFDLRHTLIFNELSIEEGNKRLKTFLDGYQNDLNTIKNNKPLENTILPDDSLKLVIAEQQKIKTLMTARQNIEKILSEIKAIPEQSKKDLYIDVRELDNQILQNPEPFIYKIANMKERIIPNDKNKSNNNNHRSNGNPPTNGNGPSFNR
ncbi:MAG TPA: hypothetical protein PLZ08_04010 [Bacillota bacterium]|nr:hypothetical protein [Bacillota bacterium]HOL09346.1 hypothetical protein [Bacillota bacterium]HPO97105.1 hypothetical protein [Bacillota bacterium]